MKGNRLLMQWQWGGMIAACLAAAAFAAWSLMRFERVRAAVSLRETQLLHARTDRPDSGVRVTLRTAGAAVVRRWDAPAFEFLRGQAIDPELGPGLDEIDLEMVVDTGKHSYAFLGAEIAGCALIIWRGREHVLADESQDRRVVLSRTPTHFEDRWVGLRFNIKPIGSGQHLVFRPLWQPVGAASSQPLPVVSNSD